MNELTPMMKQYFEIRDKCKDCILFYRLGDFYEMFFDDAKTASRELELTLTGRDCGREERAPMCGVPYHSAASYIAKLIDKGYKVAICEQTEDPSVAKGLVRREITRIITPGTIIESNILDEKNNNHIAAVHIDNSSCGIAYSDVSTGTLKTTQICYGSIWDKLIDELSRIDPAEIILYAGKGAGEELTRYLKDRTGIFVNIIDRGRDLAGAHRYIKEVFGELEILDPQYEPSMFSVYMLLAYLHDTQKRNMGNLNKAEYYSLESYMMLDPATRRNLEITETIRERSRKGSLLDIIDRTMTSMGSRLLRQYINQPLLDIQAINRRLEAVSELKDGYMLRMELREHLDGIYDIERIISRLAAGTVSLRDLISLKNSIRKMPAVKKALKGCRSELLNSLGESIKSFDIIYDLISRGITDDPPVSTKDGGYIKEGFNDEIDELLRIKSEGTGWIRRMEQEERSRTQIKNLRISYNKLFGYFIEVTNSYASLVPDEYIRKQTLANSERYITQKLKEAEDRITGAESRLVKLELQLLNSIKEETAGHLSDLKETAHCIAFADVLCSFASAAAENNYCRPEITAGDRIDIKSGRHPVVEALTGKGMFIPNDVYLDLADHRFSIITGPNMSGKSTYMRQTALIVLMAQAGSFVPADSAHIGISDRIFTRVGASDDLGSGQSTFMVEMTEMANILNNATERSLLILDEIGRGTSTFDGLSIAWAVTEYISRKDIIGARTMFATHYHELTELEGKLPGVMNYRVKVLEEGDEVIFLRKIEKGGADESYGIYVAKLAGIPDKVTERARAITAELKKSDISRMKARKKMADTIDGQLELFGVYDRENKADGFLNDLRNIEISKLTPIEALNKLYELQIKYLKG